MSRKLFCEISPLTYKISVKKERTRRHIQNALERTRFSSQKTPPLPFTVFSHKSLIRRRLGNLDMRLQENKAVNLSLAAPKINQILIRPGETFSFWHLIGKTSSKKGYREGLTLTTKGTSKDIGGGMCQMTNLLHWLTLHSPLTVTELHHHQSADWFPDCERKVPFGCGTSIVYNYVDYRILNETDQAFQFLIGTTGTHLWGKLCSQRALPLRYEIVEPIRYYLRQDDGLYRCNEVIRRCFDCETEQLLKEESILKSHAKVMYDEKYIDDDLIRDRPPINL